MINFVLADEIRSISHYRVSQLSSRNASNRQNSEGAESPSRIPRQSSIAHRNACTMLKSHTYCHSVVEEHANDILIVYDTLSEKFQSNPDLQPFEDFPVIRFYAAVPIMLGMYRIGTFCIMDPHPRYDFGDREVQMLTEMGGIVSDMLLELTKVSMIASR